MKEAQITKRAATLDKDVDSGRGAGGLERI